VLPVANPRAGGWGSVSAYRRLDGVDDALQTPTRRHTDNFSLAGPFSTQRRHHYMRDGTLASAFQRFCTFLGLATPDRARRDALLRDSALHVSTPFSLLPHDSAHGPGDVSLSMFIGRATPDRAGARPYRRTCPNVHCDMASLPSHGTAYSNPTTNFIEDGETGI
jgi:hypothetical protein